MKKYYGLSIVILLMTLALTSCGGSETSQGNQSERVISVKAEVVSPRNVQVTRTFTGSLEGARQAVLYAKIAEAVTAVDVREGQAVAAGAILVSLDKNGPSSNYLQSRSLYANAEKNYKKMEYLYNEGAVSESQYDAAKTDYEVQEASFKAASQLVDIETPINGLVTSVDVSAGDFVMVGQKLATVASTDKLRVKFGVNSVDIGHFRKGARVVVSSDAVEGSTTGEVVTVAASADPVTRAFQVEAHIDNSRGVYRPGMFVRINIVLEDLDNVIAVPRKAVVTLDGQPTIFSVVNGTARKNLVSLGSEIDGHIVITSGVSAGDTVVTLGQDYLDDGYNVKIAALSEGQ
ncbi:MAG: efflux RND transporter periplasmic adaptor subunit [Candidatus Zixiibacteriota bacterium]|nr:MAG: efflux RND transporter periplasmic adaptor subunit [candidate division Zixibacteria bacterium]